MRTLVTVLAFALLIVGNDCLHTTDHLAHAKFALSGHTPTYPVWHWTFLAFSRLVSIPIAVALTGAVAFGAVAWLTARQLPQHYSWCVLALAMAYPLPNWWQGRDVYTWLVSANFWHNPTANACLPFALVSFFVGVRAIEDRRRDWRTLSALSLLLALSVMAKPNWFLAFTVPLGVGLFTATLQVNTLFTWSRLALVFGPATVIFVWQGRQVASAGAGVIWAPLELWRWYSPCIPAAIVLGLAYPLVAVALFPVEANRSKSLALAWSAQVMGILQFALLMESGSRWGDGNLGWGMLIACHVLFVATTVFVTRQSDGWRKRLALTTLVLHALSGFVYLRWLFEL
jgi:hypothetical protein